MDVERVHALRDALQHTEWWSRASSLGRALRATSGAGSLLLVGTPRVEPWHLAAHLDDEARLSGLPQLAPSLVRFSPPVEAPPHLSIGLGRLERVARGETVFVVSPEPAPDPLLERVEGARRTGATVVALDSGPGPLADLAHERMTVSPSGLSLPDSLLQLLAPSPLGPTRLGDERAERGERGGRDRSERGERGDAFPGADAPPWDLPIEESLGRLRGVAPEVAAGLALPASFELAQHFVSTAAGSPVERSRGWRIRLGSLLDAISGPRPSSIGG